MAKRRKRYGKPVALGDIFAGQPGAKKGASLVQLYKVQKAWTNAVGEALAKRTFPKRVQGNKLIVAAESPAWSHHLQLMKEHILEAIRESTGKEYEGIRFVTEPIPDLDELRKKQKLSKPWKRKEEVHEDLSTLLKRVGKLRQEFEAERTQKKKNT